MDIKTTPTKMRGVERQDLNSIGIILAGVGEGKIDQVRKREKD